MKNDTVLKNRVRELRRRLHVRQADLADAVGVTRQTVLAIEKGRLNPSVALSLRLARFLGEPVDYVFYLERRPEPVDIAVTAGLADFTYSDTPAEPTAVFDFV